jgi:PTS system N-acetylglucosamine-specific IIA component
MPLDVGAPLAGRVIALTDVPDPVFRAALVGPGIAIEPGAVAESVVVAPVAGTIVKLHTHAFVIAAGVGTGVGTGVLVHLGVDTVQLQGEGFVLHASEGDVVVAGQPLVTWSPRDVVAGGRSAVCPVVVLETEPDAVEVLARAGSDVVAGADLLAVRAVPGT